MKVSFLFTNKRIQRNFGYQKASKNLCCRHINVRKRKTRMSRINIYILKNQFFRHRVLFKRLETLYMAWNRFENQGENNDGIWIILSYLSWMFCHDMKLMHSLWEVIQLFLTPRHKGKESRSKFSVIMTFNENVKN